MITLRDTDRTGLLMAIDAIDAIEAPTAMMRGDRDYIETVVAQNGGDVETVRDAISIAMEYTS